MPQKIIVGYDGSETGQSALEFAVDLAKARGADLVLAHVLEWSPYSFLTPEEIEQRHKRRKEELERAETAVLAPVVKSLQGQGVTVTTVLKYGHIADTLCKIAKDENASQIVVGRTGESGLSARLFGSVAGSLAQASPVPVTIVP
jgi:nucleotide-binding universal stress UspA family protein